MEAMKRRTFLGLISTTAALTTAALAGVNLLRPSKEALAASMVQPKRCGGLDYPTLTKKRIAKLFADIEWWDERVDQLWFNPADAKNIVSVFGHDVFDETSHRVLRKMGIVGVLWGATVFQNDNIPVGFVGMVSGSETEAAIDKMTPSRSEWPVPTRLRSLKPSQVDEVRTFNGVLDWPADGKLHVEVRGLHYVEPIPGYPGVSHVYEIEGRKQPFIRCSGDHELCDQEVINGVLDQLAARSSKVESSQSTWLSSWRFRTSVQHYRLALPDSLGYHTDVDYNGLIKAGKIGPIV